MKTLFRHLALLALAAAMVVACTVEEPLVEEPAVEEPVAKANSVKVTVGAGIASGTSTKSEVVTDNGARVLKFSTTDRLYVWGDIGGNKYLAGYLAIDATTISPSGTSASFSGTYGTELQAYEWNDATNQYTPVDYAFSTSDILGECTGVVAYLVSTNSSFTVAPAEKDRAMCGYFPNKIAATVDALMTQDLPVYGYYDNGSFPLSVGDADDCCHPIFNCTLSGLTPEAIYTLVYRNGNDIANIDETKTLGTITADEDGNVAFACYVSGATTDEEYHGFLLTNTADGSDVKIASLGTKALTSKVYNVTRAAYPQTADLTTMYSTDANSVEYYAARDGQTLSGDFCGYGYITIADGATVTLNLSSQSNQSYFSAPDNCDHAPIHCLGDAHIILAADSYNCVEAGDSSNYPAVFVPKDKTLTISGTGELVIDATGSYGAGIGGGKNIDCGNIVIAGGVITAMSKGSSAAIGSGKNGSCGTITISGGVIKEALHVDNDNSLGAAIGSGQNGSCDAITISGGQIGGTVGDIKYDGAVATNSNVAAIGCGQNGYCGDITIDKTITCVVVTYTGVGNGVNLIGSCNFFNDDTNCDVYFGKVKVFDKTERQWYDGADSYNRSVLASGTYGDIHFDNYNTFWELTPAPATP